MNTNSERQQADFINEAKINSILESTKNVSKKSLKL